jgi:hypothetical protein
MRDTPDRIMVAFEGDGAGSDRLTWGQADHYAAMVRMKTWSPLGGVAELDAGKTVADITEELRFLMSRFPSTRTKLRYDADGRPSQVVYGSGEIALDIFDAEDDDPARVAEAVRDRYRDQPFDFATDWPVRMAAVRHGGALTHEIALICHLALDAAGGATMMSDMARRPNEPITGMQPLEQARWQRSPAGRRQNDAALRYWEGILRTIDPRRFPEPADVAEPRYWEGELLSPALRLAVRTIAQRTQIDSAAIMLALYSVALAQVTGISPVVFRPLVSNRFRPGLADVVCTAVQSGLCSLDVDDAPFDEVAQRAARAALTSYKYAYFDPEDVVSLIARVERERGARIDIECFINDRRQAVPLDGDDKIPTPDDVRAALARTTFSWNISQDSPSFEQVCIHIDDAGEAMLLTVQIDGARVSTRDGEAMVRAMEHTAVRAAFGTDL